MAKFQVNQIVRGKVFGHFVVLAYRMLNDRMVVQVKPYNPQTGETSYGEMAFDEEDLLPAITERTVTHHGYNSFYGEIVTLMNTGEVIAAGFVIDRIDLSNYLKHQNVMAGF